MPKTLSANGAGDAGHAGGAARSAAAAARSAPVAAARSAGLLIAPARSVIGWFAAAARSAGAAVAAVMSRGTAVPPSGAGTLEGVTVVAPPEQPATRIRMEMRTSRRRAKAKPSHHVRETGYA